jgi:predicted Zn-dependent protease
MAIVAVLVMVASSGATSPIAVAQSARPERVYLVPLGDVFSLDYDALAAHYSQRFGLNLIVLPGVPLEPEQVDQTRQQLMAEALIARMRGAYPDLDGDPTTLLIGLTEYDMYIASTPDWRYGFALRLGSRFAVISSARMDEFNYGGQPNPSLLQARIQKMITKTLGLQYFGMPLNDDPHSVLYRSILSVQDLDAVSESL